MSIGFGDWSCTSATWLAFQDAVRAQSRAPSTSGDHAIVESWPAWSGGGFMGESRDVKGEERVRALVAADPLLLLTQAPIHNGYSTIVPTEFLLPLRDRLLALKWPKCDDEDAAESMFPTIVAELVACIDDVVSRDGNLEIG